MIKGSLLGLAVVAALSGPQGAPEGAPPSVWLRLDPLPAEMSLTTRESFDGVPPRFVLLTDGSVFVGGRRELLRGMLKGDEMQTLSRSLDRVLQSLKKTGIPPSVTVSEGPSTFRFRVLLGTPLQTVVNGFLPEGAAPSLPPLADFIRFLANFTHPSLRPFDPAQYLMVVREETLSGGCRQSRGLPPLATAIDGEVVVPERVTRGFPTGAEMSQICEAERRFTVVFRPLVPGER